MKIRYYFILSFIRKLFQFIYNLMACGKKSNNAPTEEFVLESPAPVDVSAKLSAIYRELSLKVTRLGDFVELWATFQSLCGNNYFAQFAHILGNFGKGVKIFHFSSEIIFGPLLQTFGDILLVTL